MSKQKKEVNMSMQTLQNLGLSENEVLLYTKMLNCSRSTVQQLGTLALFPRTMLYHVLNQLISRGLVEAKKEKTKTVYLVKDPETLYDLLHKKEKEFEESIYSIKELVPKLKQEYLLFGKIPNIRTFKGLEEYQLALEDSLLSNPKEILCYENLINKKPAIEVRETYERRRVMKKIKKNVLFFDSEESLHILKKTIYNDFTSFRSISKNSLIPFSVDVTLYEGKILYTTYPDNGEPTAVLIEDRNLFEMQKNIFQLLWQDGKNRTLYYTEAR